MLRRKVNKIYILQTHLPWNRHTYHGTDTPTMEQTHLPWNRHAYHGTNTPTMEQTRLPWNRHTYHGTDMPTMEQTRLPWNRHAYHGTDTPTMEQTRLQWDRHTYHPYTYGTDRPEKGCVELLWPGFCSFVNFIGCFSGFSSQAKPQGQSGDDDGQYPNRKEEYLPQFVSP